jgi:hypothetical protein
MALGFSAATWDAIYLALVQNVPWSVPTPFIKVHIGDPGGAGTANPAAETLRLALLAAFASATPGDDGSGLKEQIQNSAAALIWSSPPSAETWSHWSMWTASSGGTFVMSGIVVTPVAVSIGVPATIPISHLTIKGTKAS